MITVATDRFNLTKLSPTCTDLTPGNDAYTLTLKEGQSRVDASLSARELLRLHSLVSAAVLTFNTLSVDTE